VTPYDATEPLVICNACGCRHEARAHMDADAMDREADRAVARRDALGAAIWRARASSTRNGRIVR